MVAVFVKAVAVWPGPVLAAVLNGVAREYLLAPLLGARAALLLSPSAFITQSITDPPPGRPPGNARGFSSG